MEVLEQEKLFTSKEVCEMHNISERTLANFNRLLTSASDCMSQFVVKGGYHNSQYFYTQKAVEKLQNWLMNNKVNQGNNSVELKNQIKEVLDIGALTTCVQNTGDIESATQLCNLIMANTQAVAENKKLELQMREQQPKVEYYDDLCNSTGFTKIGDIGKQLRIGSNNIFKKLVEDKIIYRKYENDTYHYVPYYPYEKYFRMKQEYYKTSDGEKHPTWTLELTQNGVMWLTNKYKSIIKEA